MLFVEIGSLVEKLFLGIFFQKSSPIAPLARNLKFFLFQPHFSAYPPESIGMMLIMKIGRTVKQFFKWDFYGNSSLAPLE
jgi:hypothetical protein